MIAYVTVGADDIAAAKRFYAAILPALGYGLEEGPEGLSYALPVPSGQTPVLPDFYVKPTFDGRPASAGNGAMVAFEAESQAQVRVLHAAALAAGGADEGQPGFRPTYLRCKTAGREAIQVDIPLHPPLQECINSCIASAPDYQTFLQTDHGKQRSSAGFGSLMRKWCDEAGLRQCTAHGLRKACARRLKEAGVIEQELASVLGYADATNAHAIIGMGDRTTLADRAIGKSA